MEIKRKRVENIKYESECNFAEGNSLFKAN